MTNLSCRELRCNDELYRDAIKLSAQMWMHKYDIHNDFALVVDHYSIRPDGSHLLSPDSKAPAKLRQAWIRIFLLGVQVASEEKGHGGRSPTASMVLESGGVFRLPSGTLDEYAVGTDAHTNTIHISRKIIEEIVFKPGKENVFEYNSFTEAGHTNRRLNALQWALMLGVEEGLHAEANRIPENAERFIAAMIVDKLTPGEYKTDPAEVYIHDDLIRIADKIDPVYDKVAWANFALTYNKALPAPKPPLAKLAL